MQLFVLPSCWCRAFIAASNGLMQHQSRRSATAGNMTQVDNENCRAILSAPTAPPGPTDSFVNGKECPQGNSVCQVDEDLQTLNPTG